DESPEDTDATPPPDKHDLPTMPMPAEPGASDPKKTLPGSGGLDPNPDFPPQDSSPESGHTVPHIVPPQYTMVHIPGEEHKYPPPPPPPPVAKPSQYPTHPPRRPQPQPASPPPYAGPSQYTTQPSPPYVPPPPVGYGQTQPRPPAQGGKLLRRKNGRRRTFLG